MRVSVDDDDERLPVMGRKGAVATSYMVAWYLRKRDLWETVRKRDDLDIYMTRGWAPMLFAAYPKDLLEITIYGTWRRRCK